MNILYGIVKFLAGFTLIISFAIVFDDFMAGRRRAKAHAKFLKERLEKYK